MISIEKPKGFKKEIEVVACYVECNGNFLLLQRQNGKTHENKFGLPAGKVDSLESPDDAIIREVLEETSIELKKSEVDFINTLYVINNGHSILYHTYKVVLNEVREIKLSEKEHKSFCWVSPVEAIKMDLVHDLADCIKMHYTL